MLLHHAAAIARDLHRRGFAGIGWSGVTEGEVLGEGDLPAHGAAEQHVEGHALGLSARVPHRHLDAAKGATLPYDIAPGRIAHAREAAALGRGDLADVEAQQPLAELQHIRRPVAVGDFAETGNAIVGCHLDDGLGQRSNRAIAEHIGRGERNIDRRGLDVGDLHLASWSPIRRLPYSSTVSVWPGRSTVTDAASSITAGPAMRWPARSVARSNTGVSCASSSNTTRRRPAAFASPAARAILVNSGFCVTDTAVTMKFTISIIWPGMAKPKRAACMSWNACHSCGVVLSSKLSNGTGTSSS